MVISPDGVVTGTCLSSTQKTSGPAICHNHVESSLNRVSTFASWVGETVQSWILAVFLNRNFIGSGHVCSMGLPHSSPFWVQSSEFRPVDGQSGCMKFLGSTRQWSCGDSCGRGHCCGHCQLCKSKDASKAQVDGRG